ncbi:CUE domain-containing protein [Trichophyton tonsurans CBS 112818]|uniref:CUE domain-containing protein n=1 Tax=Trichophyton tonsurans (strain CBS 112818) TaxID=647933 RepID=F2RRV9_TRIT1|nr:CUE domain-containing protein [Trichophyton tonsurans CBS 112818]
MAETDRATSTPKKATGLNPESPTTARPLDFDDEPQETGLTSANTTSRSSSQLNLAANMQNQSQGQPPRAPNPYQRIIDDLKEAFPNIDAPVVKAVVVASDGNVERAFNALLGMSDPDAQEEVRPAVPPRPSAGGVATSTTQSQLEDDERYARQLAEHYSGADQRRGYQQQPSSSIWDHGPASGQRGQGLKPNELYDKEHSFLDDDLPIIKENIRKGFLETQSRVNSWVENFKRRLDGEESDEDAQYGHSQRQYGQRHQQQQQQYGYPNRRSVDRERYDADPHVLGDDFSSLELRDNEVPPPRPPRPQANPDLFKSKSASASPDRRKVSFQEGPPEEIQDSLSANTSSNINNSNSNNNNNTSGTANKSSKWQPLSTVEPSPVADNDPFSLGDSDDERESKAKDVKGEDAAKKAEKTSA